MSLSARGLHREGEWDGKVGRKGRHGGGTAGKSCQHWADRHRAVRGLTGRGDVSL